MPFWFFLVLQPNKPLSDLHELSEKTGGFSCRDRAEVPCLDAINFDWSSPLVWIWFGFLMFFVLLTITDATTLTGFKRSWYK